MYSSTRSTFSRVLRQMHSAPAAAAAPVLAPTPTAPAVRSTVPHTIHSPHAFYNPPTYISHLHRKVQNLQSVVNVLQAAQDGIWHVAYSEADLHAFYEDVNSEAMLTPTSEVDAQATESGSAELVSGDEWMSLLRTCIRENDMEAAERTALLMQKTRPSCLGDAINAILEVYASNGDTKHVESWMDRIIIGPPTDVQMDLHIKAHVVNMIKVGPPNPCDPYPQPVVHDFPTSALDVLHRYEASGHVAPIKSYTRVISALLRVRTSPSSNPRLGSSAARSQAWDLFSHMRYVAHPKPDVHLYAVMIRACASTATTRAEPERALDLWTEMQENRIEPTIGAYEAIILVFGQSGGEWVGESIRFAREMRARHPIRSSSSLASERRIWCAVLEGCKRAGDLNRARWILAEALRTDSVEEDGEGDTGKKIETASSSMNGKMMQHVLHTYASYQPPFSRGRTRLLDDSSYACSESSLTTRSPSETPDHFDDYGHTPSFSRLPPQTASDVIAEVDVLFRRIAQHNEAFTHHFQEDHDHFDDPLAGKFANVQITPALLNAYMSVFYAHASIERCREVFTSVFGTSQLAKFQGNAHTLVDALERCAAASKEEKPIAAQWAQELWSRWESVETRGVATGYKDVGIFARLIEKAHTAMRRVMVRMGDVDGALGLLRKFVSRYPPSTLIQPRSEAHTHATPASNVSSTTSIPIPVTVPQKSPIITLFAKPPILSTRVTLTNPKPPYSASANTPIAKPLVRLTSAIGPRDDRVPPIIGFPDVELLHHRLVMLKRIQDVGYVKWVCDSYRGTLRKRREAVLHGLVGPTDYDTDYKDVN
ncbi:hypothetical protein J3A83DRAFT_4215821 [Scleroderma citrinum]